MKRRDALKTIVAGVISVAMPPVVRISDAIISKSPTVSSLTSISDCWRIDEITGEIKYVGPRDMQFTVLEFHQMLQEFVVTKGSNRLDITAQNPSIKYTDSIIELSSNYSLDDESAQYLTGGSIITDKDIYSSSTDKAVYSNFYSLGKIDTPTPLKIKADGNTVVESESISSHFDLLIDTSQFSGEPVVSVETMNGQYDVQLPKEIKQRAGRIPIPIFS